MDGTEGGMGESLPLSLLIPQWQYIPGLLDLFYGLS